MRFPINVTNQKRCPICKKPGANRATTPRPETVSLSFSVMSFVHGRSYPVYLGSHLVLGWDSGIDKSAQSRASLGAAFFAAKKKGRDAKVGELEIRFCSTRCLRKFFEEIVDELERRVAAVEPAVRAARSGSSRRHPTRRTSRST